MDREYTLSYIVNAGPAVEQLTSVRTTVRAVGYSAEASARQLGMFATALDKVEASAKGGHATIGATKQHIEDMAKAANTAGQNTAALTQSLTPATKNIIIMGEEVSKTTTATTNMGGSFVSLYAGMQVFNFGSQLAQTFLAHIEAAHKRLDDLAKKATETRDKMRELAHLEGKTGPDDKLVTATTLLGMENGLDPEEAAKFMTIYRGSASSGIQKGNITPEVYDQVAAEGMRLGKRTQMETETAATFTGMLSHYHKIPNVVAAAGEMGSIIKSMDDGRSHIEPLIRSLIKTGGDIVKEDAGGVETLAELAPIIGTLNLMSSPDRAGTLTRAATRAVRHFNVDAIGRAHDKQTATLMDLGITPNMRLPEAIAKLAAPIEQANKDKIGGDVWLEQHGFKEVKELSAISFLATNKKLLDERLTLARENANSGKETIEANNAFLHENKAGQQHVLTAKTAAQELIMGMGKEDLRLGREAGAILAIDQGNMLGTVNWLRHAIQSSAQMFGGQTGEVRESENAFMAHLETIGKPLGIKVKEAYREALYKEYPGSKAVVDDSYMQEGRWGTDVIQTHPKLYTKILDDFRAKHIDPFDVPTDAPKNARRLVKAEEELNARKALNNIAPEADGSFKARVLDVGDGDTITVDHNGRRETIRLSTIDAPEVTHNRDPKLDQAGGQAAKAFATGLAFGKMVTIHPTKDATGKSTSYGRTLANVELPGGADLGMSEVETGNAWWYEHYDANDPKMKAAQTAAQKARLGIWSKPNPQNPADFRRDHPINPGGDPTAKGIADMVEQQKKTNIHLENLQAGPGRAAATVVPGRK